MKMYNKTVICPSNGVRVTYTNVTEMVREAIKESEITNGQVVVVSPHTTCAVMFEEFTHDLDYNGDEFLQVDMNMMLDRICPRELSENTNYRYPGQKHCDFLTELNKIDPSFPADPGTILNGDAHLRASLYGSSKTFIVLDGKLAFGKTGYIYFVDFDQNRARNRKCHIQIIGE